MESAAERSVGQSGVLIHPAAILRTATLCGGAAAILRVHRPGPRLGAGGFIFRRDHPATQRCSATPSQAQPGQPFSRRELRECLQHSRTIIDGRTVGQVLSV